MMQPWKKAAYGTSIKLSSGMSTLTFSKLFNISINKVNALDRTPSKVPLHNSNSMSVSANNFKTCFYFPYGLRNL